MSITFIKVYFLAIAMCVICFTEENLASPYKCRNVELICSTCQEKTLCLSKKYHMDGTGSSEKNIYLSGAHVTS